LTAEASAPASPNRWLPKLVLSLRDYSAHKFTQDLAAGITVGLVALPLAMAFGISSGVTPQAGLYTAVVAGFIISALGGSRVQIGGPTGAFVVIVAGIVAKFGIEGLAVVTLMAGAMLVVMGATGLGSAVIASTEIKDFFGLTTPPVPSEFLPRMRVLLENASTANLAAIALGAFSLAIVILLPRWTKRIPGSIVALLLCTAASVFFHLPVETIGSKFGGIPRGFPHFALPDLSHVKITPLIPAAFTVAMLAAIESLLSAVVADGMSGDRHNSNVELIAQGIANIFSPMFGGIPATGAIARTATNVRSGAKTPVAGIIHSITLLLILLIAAPIARFIPLATLAAVLFVVAYNMGEWREIGVILRLAKTDISVWAATFALTVLADLTVAVEVGMALAALLYIHRISETTSVTPVTEDYLRAGYAHVLQDKQLPPYVMILRIHGPFLFGTTEKLAEATRDLKDFPPVLALRLRNMTALDATGLHAIAVLAKRLRASGRTLLLCGARDQPHELISESALADEIGRKNILPHVDAALARAKEVYEDFGGVGGEFAEDMSRAPV